MTDVLDLAKRLMAAPSVTPATGAVFDAMEAMLVPLGFEVTRFTRGEGAVGTPEAPVENLLTISLTGSTSEMGTAGRRSSRKRNRPRRVASRSDWSSMSFVYSLKTS